MQSEIYSLFWEYGNFSTAYHTLQPDLEYYVETSVGYVAFKRIPGMFGSADTILVPGNPVVSSNERHDLLKRFLLKYPQAAFFQVDGATAMLLSELGHYVNEFGVDTTLYLPYTLSGGRRADIRLLCNRARAAGVTIIELTRSDRPYYNIQDNDIIELCNIWIRSRIARRREFTFLARRYNYRDEKDCRKFYALQNGKLVGLSVFDPIYDAGSVRGYAEVIVRTSSTAPKGTRDFLLLSAMEKMTEENIEYVSLGLSPLAEVTDIDSGMEKLRRSRFITSCFNFAYYRLDKIVFNFQGLSFKKGRYAKKLHYNEGKIEKRYCSFPAKFPVRELYRAYKATVLPPLPNSIQENFVRNPAPVRPISRNSNNRPGRNQIPGRTVQ